MQGQELSPSEGGIDNQSNRSAQTQQLNRIERWTGAFYACMGGATDQERAMAVSLEYTCACFATFIVSRCAQTDTTTTNQVMGCVEASEAASQRAFTTCLGFGPLSVEIEAE